MTYTHCFSLSSTSLTNFSRGGMSRQVSGESAWAERSRGVNTEDPQIGNVQNLKPWKKNTFQNCKEKPTKITVGNSTISVHSFWVDDSKPWNCQVGWLQQMIANVASKSPICMCATPQCLNRHSHQPWIDMSFLSKCAQIACLHGAGYLLAI